MIGKVLKRLGIALAALTAVLLSAYFIIYSAFSGLDTVKVKISEVSDSVMVKGLVLREETPVVSQSSQYISYTAKDGTKVNAGGTVANIYASESAKTNQAERTRISNELQSMKKLNSNIKALTVSLDVVENQIYSSLKEHTKALVSGDYTKLRSSRESLLYYMNERAYLTGEQPDFSERISELEAKMEQYPDESGELVGSVVTDIAGVFSSTADGYESCFDYSKIEKMTLDDYKSIKAGKADKSAIGKLVTDVTWYFVCPVTADQALTLNTTEEQIKISFLTSASGAVNAELVTINQRDKRSDGLAVFSCDAMNKKLINMRNEEARIDLSTYSGLRIPKKALRTKTCEVTETDSDGNEHTSEKAVQGVYIKHVNELMFREVVIIYSSKNYVICDPNPSDDDLLLDNGTVSQYDEVVTEGAELYDGKIVR